MKHHYQCHHKNGNAVHYNEFNQIVQCHACGVEYKPVSSFPWIAVILTIALLIVLGTADLKAQSVTCANNDQLVIDTSTKTYKCITPGALPAGTGTTMILANETITGTTANRLAKLTGAPSQAVVTSTSDTENAVGVVTAGAGTTGNATITILGQASCEFDGATTAGNYVVISAITAGMCHDGGSSFPNAQAAYGRVLSTNGGAGTYVIELMTPDLAFQNAGNGKSKPGTPANSYQFNSSNTFTGGSLSQASTDVIELANGTSATNTRLNIYGLKNGGNTENLALGYVTADTTYRIFTTAAGSGTVRRIEWATGTSGTQAWQLGTTGNFGPTNASTGVKLEMNNAGGSTTVPAIGWGTTGFSFISGGPFVATLAGGGSNVYTGVFGNYFGGDNRVCLRWSASGAPASSDDVGICRISAGVLEFTDGSLTGAGGAAGSTKVKKHFTGTNCTDSAGAAACGSASAGSVVIDAGSTSVVVSTTSVTADSQIFVQYDSSLSTRLSVTCNTTPALPAITARTAGTSFTITVPAAPVTNPACYSYFIVN